jgi:hypothetical protein
MAFVAKGLEGSAVVDSVGRNLRLARPHGIDMSIMPLVPSADESHNDHDAGAHRSPSRLSEALAVKFPVHTSAPAVTTQQPQL